VRGGAILLLAASGELEYHHFRRGVMHEDVPEAAVSPLGKRL
jgi:hypothetical protein